MMRHRVGWILFVGALLALFLAACGAPPGPIPEPAITEAPAEVEAEATEAVEVEKEVEVVVTEAAEAEPTEEPEPEPELAATEAPAPTEAPEPTEAPPPAVEVAATQTPEPTEEEAEEEAAAEESAGEEEGPTSTPEGEGSEDAGATAIIKTPTLAPIATIRRVTPSPVPAVPTIVVESPVPATATPAPIVEEREVELEWPSSMRFGESDLVRLSLIRTEEGYVVEKEFEEHEVQSTQVVVEQRPGYDLFGVARLHSTSFDLSPEAEQEQSITGEEEVTWYWTISPHKTGQHRLAVQLALRWVPQEGNPGRTSESTIYDKGLTVEVFSFFGLGLTTQQATISGFAGLALGSTLTLPLALYALRPRRRSLFQDVPPNRGLVIEQNPAIDLLPAEESLLRALFHAYGRLTLEAEFRSGYSGARIFLILPVRDNGRADAFTIAKLGELADIEQEFYNYETFVKHTLPPITARILDRPITPSSGIGSRFLLSTTRFSNSSASQVGQLAALRYTFIGEAGRMPTSLRQALLNDPNPALLERLLQTFGPNWWMQRRPYTFRLAQEYDRMLPSHYMLTLAEGSKAEGTLDGGQPPGTKSLQIGDVVTLRNIKIVERREEHGYLSLRGETVPGNPPLRLRLYLQDAGQLRALTLPEKNWRALPKRYGGDRGAAKGLIVRVSATRESLLRDYVADFDLYGLSDPLPRVSALFNEQLFGTQSPIHGDLNLENVLIGLGDFVWLIDFALTREGHTLYDFAHLGANIIAHVLAPRIESPAAYVDLLRANNDPLLTTLHSMAQRCLFHPNQPREFQLALFATCVGALKYRNLNNHQKHLLYLSAAYLAESL
ncbi:MAG: phosphotransferase [Ardenticatenaceae bacterium]